MFARKGPIALLLLAALMAVPFAISAAPKPQSNQPERKKIDLYDPANVDGKALAPGKYDLLIEGNKVTFERDGKTIVSAACDWKTENYKAQYDSVTTSSNHTLQDISFEGSNEVLEIK